MIISSALFDAWMWLRVRSEWAFIRSAKDNACLERMSFDKRKSTQMTLSSNMTGSRLPANINPAQVAKCKQRAFLTCGYTTVIFGNWRRGQCVTSTAASYICMPRA